MGISILLLMIWTMFLLVISLSVRADFKNLREGSNKLHDQWSKYYAESRKYRQMDSVEIKYKDGRTQNIPALSFRNTENTIEIYNEDSKITALINISEIESVKVIRSDKYVMGERSIHDEY